MKKHAVVRVGVALLLVAVAQAAGATLLAATFIIVAHLFAPAILDRALTPRVIAVWYSLFVVAPVISVAAMWGFLKWTGLLHFFRFRCTHDDPVDASLVAKAFRRRIEKKD